MIKILTLALPLFIGLISFKFSNYKLKKELKSNSSPLSDPLLVTIVNRLFRQLNLNEFKILVYDSSSINGLAAPDGSILLTKGFINAYYQGRVTAEEIASVVAHELGHVALNHHSRRVIDFGMQSTIRYTFGFLLSRFVPVLGNYILEIFMKTISAKLSRSDEYAADKYAAALLIKTGIGVEPMITLFKKLDHLTGASNPKIAWLTSHPKSIDRIKNISQLNKNWSNEN